LLNFANFFHFVDVDTILWTWTQFSADLHKIFVRLSFLSLSLCCLWLIKTKSICLGIIR